MCIRVGVHERGVFEEEVFILLVDWLGGWLIDYGLIARRVLIMRRDYWMGLSLFFLHATYCLPF